MERYEEYKDSGVQWLGEIPEHWSVVPFKSCFCLEKGLSITKADLVEDGIPVISYGQIHSKKNIYTKVLPELQRFIPYFYEESFPQCLLYKDDFVFADTSEDTIGSGNFVRVDNEKTIFAGYHTIIGRNKKREYGHYLSYLFQSSCWRSQIWTKVQGVKLFSISRGILFLTKILIPPLFEQQAIVSFLDTKTSQIDTYIAGKEKEIDLLKSTKQRIIADAVTKGITPGVEMKESGIAWVGKIPAHWDMLRNKAFLRMTDEKVGNRNDLKLLSLTKLGVIVRDLSEGKGKFPKDFDSYLVVYPNNLIFCLFDIDETPRTVGLVHHYGMLTGAYTNFEVDESIVIPEFAYYYYLQVDDVKGLRPYYTGLRKVVKSTTFLQIRMPVPPLPEQRSIVAHIKEKTEAIDAAIEKLTNQIELMKKYKQRLISDVVTGQIKVC